jgi:hypothetical protein
MQCKYREFHNVCVGLDVKDVIQASWTCARCNKVYSQSPAESDEGIFSEDQESKTKLRPKAAPIGRWAMPPAQPPCTIGNPLLRTRQTEIVI